MCVTNVSESLRCCIEDGSRSPEIGLQELVSNRPVLLRSKGVVVSADDASLRLKALSKLRSISYLRINRDDTCLRTRWQPV